MKKYGCFDRPPYKTSQVLYGHDSLTGKVITIEIPNRLAQDCRYTHTELGQADARCVGCKWRSGVGPVVALDHSGEAPPVATDPALDPLYLAYLHTGVTP